MWDVTLRVVTPGRIPDPYNPSSPGTITLDPDQGATVGDEIHYVECQPISLVEEDQGGVRVHVATSWRIITRPGHNIAGLSATDGVVVEGVDGVLSVQGEVGRIVHPVLGHDEFTVARQKG